MSPESDIYVSRNPFTREVEDHASCIELNTHLFFKSWAGRAKCMGLTSAIEFTVKKKTDLPARDRVSMVSKKVTSQAPFLGSLQKSTFH